MQETDGAKVVQKWLRTQVDLFHRICSPVKAQLRFSSASNEHCKLCKVRVLVEGKVAICVLML